MRQGTEATEDQGWNVFAIKAVGVFRFRRSAVGNMGLRDSFCVRRRPEGSEPVLRLRLGLHLRDAIPDRRILTDAGHGQTTIAGIPEQCRTLLPSNPTLEPVACLGPFLEQIFRTRKSLRVA